MTLGERIKKVRKELDLTQQKFADRLGVKQNTIALIESGKRNTSDQLLFSVCREFNVSETWLRTEEGEIFNQPQGREEEIQYMVENLLQGRKAEFKYRLISVLNTLNEDQWETLERYLMQITDEQDKPSQPVLTEEEKLERDADEFAANAAKIAREQFLAEKKLAKQALSVSESAVG